MAVGREVISHDQRVRARRLGDRQDGADNQSKNQLSAHLFSPTFARVGGSTGPTSAWIFSDRAIQLATRRHRERNRIKSGTAIPSSGPTPHLPGVPGGAHEALRTRKPPASG